MAATESGCDGIGILSVFRVLETVFLCTSGQGIPEQAATDEDFDQFGDVPRGLPPTFPRGLGRGLIRWDFRDFCCDEPHSFDQDPGETRRCREAPISGLSMPAS